MVAQNKKKKAVFDRAKERKSKPVNRDKVIAMADELAQPICDAEGLELVHIEYQREPAGWVLRLYIDRPGAVTLDSCARISRQLGDLLDVYLESVGPYHLEVSSPGPDRPLGRQQDFVRFRGHIARIKTAEPVNGKKSFKGVLSGFTDGTVQLWVDDKTVAIPYQQITRARLINYNGESRCL